MRLGTPAIALGMIALTSGTGCFPGGQSAPWPPDLDVGFLVRFDGSRYLVEAGPVLDSRLPVTSSAEDVFYVVSLTQSQFLDAPNSEELVSSMDLTFRSEDPDAISVDGSRALLRLPEDAEVWRLDPSTATFVADEAPLLRGSAFIDVALSALGCGGAPIELEPFTNEALVSGPLVGVIEPVDEDRALIVVGDDLILVNRGEPLDFSHSLQPTLSPELPDMPDRRWNLSGLTFIKETSEGEILAIAMLQSLRDDGFPEGPSALMDLSISTSSASILRVVHWDERLESIDSNPESGVLLIGREGLVATSTGIGASYSRFSLEQELRQAHSPADPNVPHLIGGRGVVYFGDARQGRAGLRRTQLTSGTPRSIRDIDSAMHDGDLSIWIADTRPALYKMGPNGDVETKRFAAPVDLLGSCRTVVDDLGRVTTLDEPAALAVHPDGLGLFFTYVACSVFTYVDDSGCATRVTPSGFQPNEGGGYVIHDFERVGRVLFLAGGGETPGRLNGFIYTLRL